MSTIQCSCTCPSFHALLSCLLCTIIILPTNSRLSCHQPLNIISITNGNAASSTPSISADGRFIAFASNADNLVKDDTNQVADIFVYDRQLEITQRVSISSTGEQANAYSAQPVISADGRTVAFESLASNLVAGDANGYSDIFVRDLLTNETSRISIDIHGHESNGCSEGASISEDGRSVAFVSLASNLFPGDENETWDAFVYDRLTGFQQRVSLGSNGENANAETRAAAINPYGSTVTFISKASNILESDTNQGADLFAYNRQTFHTVHIAAAEEEDTPTISTGGQWLGYLSPNALQDKTSYMFDQLEQETYTAQFPIPLTQQVLSPNGRYIFAIGTSDGNQFDLFRHDIESEDTITLAKNVNNIRPAISRHGDVIAYVQTTDDISQIVLVDMRNNSNSIYTISGWVSNHLDDPLAQVVIEASRGTEKWRTETDGQGRFFLGSIPEGRITIKPSKTGFSFEPDEITLNVTTDINKETQFTYSYNEVLEEAHIDIGMPYDHRCEEGSNCTGVFHGYAAGQCTDLVLDAFTWGAEYNIKMALRRDAQAHPEHFYQSTNARDAYDMWRYFMYSGQMLPHESPYQIGDLVFFDWTDNGEINHVALVSQVSEKNRPIWMVDASGVTYSNPSGRAAELPWEMFHENSVRGHARWNGAYQSPVVGMPTITRLQVGVGSVGALLKLSSNQGFVISEKNTPIPGSWFFNLRWEKSLSVPEPHTWSNQYQAIISNPTATLMAYYFVAQLVSGESIQDVIQFRGTLAPKSTHVIPLRLLQDGKLETFSWKIRSGGRPSR